MMKHTVEIWHAEQPTFRADGVTLDNFQQTHRLEDCVDLYSDTAEELCEQAFTFSQNNHLQWKSMTRSSSVGDVFVIPEAGIFLIKPVGFIQLC